FHFRDVVKRFDAYVAHVVEELGDLCTFWCTFNEPNIYAVAGYLVGDFPPGHHGDVMGAVKVQAVMARAHAAAYHTIHHLQPAARVGWAHHFLVFDPARPNARLDRLVAQLQDGALHGLFPRAVRSGTAPFLLRWIAGDLRGVRGTCDYVGINLYYRDLV